MKLVILTDRHQSEAAGRGLAETVVAAVGAGAPTVLFREKDLAGGDRRALGLQVAEACGEEADLVVASDVDLAVELGARGIHLAARDRWPDTSLEVGRSCHDAAEVADAEAHRAAFVTASPVFATSSKPGYGPELGVGGLAALVAGTHLPVYALGGVTGPADIAACRAAGAAGVAVMGAVMTAPDPGHAVWALLAELDR